MMSAARVVGVLVLGYGAVGLALTWLAHDTAPLAPLWSDQLWTAAARRAADWAAYAALAAGGLALRLEPRHAVWPLAALVLLTGAMLGYDALVADPDMTRQRAMLRADLALAVAAATALFASIAALDDALERGMG
jgi:hypothetical protein